MQSKDNRSIFEISSADTMRFRRIVIDVMSEACRLSLDDEFDGIGRLAEKQMHAAIKRFICPDESKHEILIDGSAGCKNFTNEDISSAALPPTRQAIPSTAEARSMPSSL